MSLKNRFFFLLFYFFVKIPTDLKAVEEDRRCFLKGGGSMQNFFVSESLSVGDVIGALKIVGDASAKGDIFLKLENPKSSPVQISSYSKSLVLTERLDKEGVTGRSHFVINVVCRKKASDDVDTKIPINIRVTDSNDNAPIFIKAPYYVNVSEATVKGTVIVGDINAFDRDQKGPYSDIHYKIPRGPHSDKFEFESPMSGALVLKKELDYETDSLFNLTIAAEDRGIPPQRTETFVTIQVIDSDDQNPMFTNQRYMAFLPYNPVKGSILNVQPERIFAEDQDKGIKAPVFYSFGQDVEEVAYLQIKNRSGDVMIANDIPDTFFTQPVALSVMATQINNPDRKATVILSVSRRGTASNQLQFLQRVYEKTLNENLPIGTIIAKSLINKKIDETIRFSLEYGGLGIFSISPVGEIYLSYNLDYEKQKIYNIKIYVTDGEYSDTAVLRVTILNVNDWDPRFQYPQYSFHVKKEPVEPGYYVGNVTVADGDGDDILLSLKGRDARMFSVNAKGEISIKSIARLNKTEANIVLVAKDSGKPSRESSVPVTVHFPKGIVEALWVGPTTSYLLMMVFGSLLAIFVFVIICLVIYIHRNKKLRDDVDAAKPTKMSQIISNGGIPASKLSPLSAFAQTDHQREMDVTEAPKSNGSTFDPSEQTFRTTFINGGFHDNERVNAATINKSYSRGTNGTSYGRGLTIIDVSDNGSDATTSSTATNGSGSDSSPVFGRRSSSPRAGIRFGKSKVASEAVLNICTRDGIARATGGLPTVSTSVIPPAPPAPTTGTFLKNFTRTHNKNAISPSTNSNSHPNSNSHSNSLNPHYNSSNFHSNSPNPHSNSDSPDMDNFCSNELLLHRKKLLSPQSSIESNCDRRIAWPSSSIPKKVKKLSWQDELNCQTELDPDVSVTPMPQKLRKNEESNVTVYF